MRYHAYTHKRHGRVPHRVWWLMLAAALVIAGGIVWSRHDYTQDLLPVSDNPKTQLFTIASGSSVKAIAANLQSQHLIRSAWALELYVHSKELSDKLQAGTFALSPDQGTASIVSTLTRGNVATELVTILPGRRIDQVRADLINDGFKPGAVDTALDPAQYGDLPVMSFKPANVHTLEGLLWPDSFEKDPATSPSVIIRESLEEMGQKLTPNVQAAFAGEGLTTYQGLTLTSMLIQEVNTPGDMAQAAQVFLSRLKTNMPLGSDVTAEYGAIAAGQSPSLSYDSPYNTLLHPGLPPTPISTVNATALNAATHPANTNYLYFVTGDNGTTYFSTNLQDQQKNTQLYCHKLCGQ